MPVVSGNFVNDFCIQCFLVMPVDSGIIVNDFLLNHFCIKKIFWDEGVKTFE